MLHLFFNCNVCCRLLDAIFFDSVVDSCSVRLFAVFIWHSGGKDLRTISRISQKTQGWRWGNVAVFPSLATLAVDAYSVNADDAY